MKQSSALGLFLFVVAAGCYTGPHIPPDVLSGDGIGTSNTALPTDLPCEVAAVIEKCLGCHGSPPTGDALSSMTSLAELTSPSKSDRTLSVAALAAIRMRATANPMPPTGALADADIATMEAWVTAGTPAGSCTNAPAATSNYDTPTVCTSDTMWTRKNHGSSSMHPGVACIDCHAGGEGPRYFAAGTVYPSAHEPNDCMGVSGATIELTGADGSIVTLAANSAGNFATRKQVVLPYRARVVVDGNEREMVTPQTSGDCNSCHTERGTNDAPGRVMMP